MVAKLFVSESVMTRSVLGLFKGLLHLATVSPDFHWQKSLLTVGRNSFHDHTYPFVKPREVLRGYLDVAIAKFCETCMQSCAIDLQTCSFAIFSQWLHLNNLAKKLSVKLAKNGCENIWSVKVGVHTSNRSLGICGKNDIKLGSHMFSFTSVRKILRNQLKRIP